MMALISSLGTLVASCDSLITSAMADSRSVLHTKICYKITGAYCAAPTCGDWDGDGDLDIIIGFLNETLLFFERSPDTVIGTCTPDDFPCNTNDACDAVSFECSCILGYEGDDCASCSGNCHCAVTDVEDVSWWNGGAVGSCRPCLGMVGKARVCSRRGKCNDDASACGGNHSPRILLGVVHGSGNCSCSVGFGGMEGRWFRHSLQRLCPGCQCLATAPGGSLL